jgi:hypothetical protein
MLHVCLSKRLLSKEPVIKRVLSSAYCPFIRTKIRGRLLAWVTHQWYLEDKELEKLAEEAEKFRQAHPEISSEGYRR